MIGFDAPQINSLVPDYNPLSRICDHACSRKMLEIFLLTDQVARLDPARLVMPSDQASNRRLLVVDPAPAAARSCYDWPVSRGTRTHKRDLPLFSPDFHLHRPTELNFLVAPHDLFSGGDYNVKAHSVST